MVFNGLASTHLLFGLLCCVAIAPGRSQHNPHEAAGTQDPDTHGNFSLKLPKSVACSLRLPKGFRRVSVKSYGSTGYYFKNKAGDRISVAGDRILSSGDPEDNKRTRQLYLDLVDGIKTFPSHTRTNYKHWEIWVGLMEKGAMMVNREPIRYGSGALFDEDRGILISIECKLKPENHNLSALTNSICDQIVRSVTVGKPR